MKAADVSRGDWLRIGWLLRDARALSVSILFLIVSLTDRRQLATNESKSATHRGGGAPRMPETGGSSTPKPGRD
jgi:hypothetical protein